MKAKKALKQLTKIEALMANVSERFNVRAPHMKAVLNDLKAALERVTEAVTQHGESASPKKTKPPAPAGAKKVSVSKKIARPKRAAQTAPAKTRKAAGGRKSKPAAAKKKAASAAQETRAANGPSS